MGKHSKPMTNEHKQKIAATKIGRKRSEETKAAISAGRKKYEEQITMLKQRYAEELAQKK